MANPNQLSGGQKHLVALGGVLTLRPDIIVFDETMSQLDVTSQMKVKNVMLSLKQAGKTLIMIEHDRKSLEIADEVWSIDRGSLKRLPSSEEGSDG
jgi:energy-coupling factor transport system ATP-binding protein